MTDIIERLEKLYAEATGGEWEAIAPDAEWVYGGVDITSLSIYSSEKHDGPNGVDNKEIVHLEPSHRLGLTETRANFKLIALTHNALPELLRLARVGREVESMKGATNGNV